MRNITYCPGMPAAVLKQIFSSIKKLSCIPLKRACQNGKHCRFPAAIFPQNANTASCRDIKRYPGKNVPSAIMF